MESVRLSQIKTIIFVYLLTICAVYSERGAIIQYQCAERSVCECSEGLHDPLYTGIITIDCRHRNLTQVPSLIGIPNFKYYRFILRDNHITLINSRDFRYSMFIQIDLGGTNYLNRVADKAFVSTSRYLKHLILNVRQLNIYKLRFLHAVPKLHELTLEGGNSGRQTTLPRRIFPGYKLKAMTKLSLSGFGLIKIAWDAFLGVSNLKVLCLARNNLSVVPSAALKGLQRLTELDLSRNRLKILENNPFGQLYKLSKLDLSHNLLDRQNAIAPNAFTDLKNCLKVLTISNSSLTRIPSESLRNLKVLSHLNLSYNQIEDIATNSSPFSGGFKLRELDISGNNMELSSKLFGGIETFLRRLTIRQMRLKEIPKDFLRNFIQLRHLDMSNNLLKRLPPGFNKGLHIRHFVLKHMDISNVSSRAFVKPSHAAKLHVDLSSNRLNSVGFISETEPCTFLDVSVFNNPVLCDCALYGVVSDDTINVRGRCSGGGKHFRHVSFSDHTLVDTLRRVCIIPESRLDPCRRLDAQWKAHRQMSGVDSAREKICAINLLISWMGMKIFVF